MMYTERFSNLPAHVWPRLRALLDGHEGGGTPIHMTIGEPKHAFPAWVTDEITKHAAGFNKYPPNDGSPELRAAIAAWIARRYGVEMDPDNEVMALNGTREGLYNAVIALCPPTKNGEKSAILMPNPFYQVYMIGAISGEADPIMVPATAETGHLPDFASLPEEVLRRTTAAYLCSPANPQGVVASRDYWADLIALTEKYDFLIFADECYSEIYRDTPPTGALEVVKELGTDRNRVVIFHSLSKRSNLPGLRSGFAASGAETMRQIKQLRNYAGAPLPLPLQQAAAAVWADEAHVEENRALYQEKYAIADRIFGNVPGYVSPEAGFFLWLPVEDDEAAALKLWRETGVRVLPGSYLAQNVAGGNPGQNYIRVALVAPKDETTRGLEAIRDCLYSA
ncbi:aminotransferase class I/II-fold pyridoxal phosphate-dependent enzyme [Sulfitobacter sp. R18_1]|uniref:aminotransferase class I/II-fold pyridoxal phosphate-dependent enzyme n=1 Tax=Sulfitobacter sp. R18_1 TaxID=2821104 RepID=UPI001ADCF919|nr:aminotransferase class I/II-fold pyridoxal phosphate-dependent enzyme [Sulfitobacter sp. R18_1]MBO9430989.1 aminotransferase class I/II-fold pyridoxal phosphate-dependent enzyme [Sulfitobacter sp. R18_1]